MRADIDTARLRLRPWRDGDLARFAAMNADPAVMAYFPSILSREESDRLAERIRAGFDERGLGLRAVEVVARGEECPFIGFVGLSSPVFEAHFTPCVEIGWRLMRKSWGRGYATEAAQATLAFGLRELGLPEIVSFTAKGNFRSRRVMERIGMRYASADDFEHPNLPEGHVLREHVLYRMSRADWQASLKEGDTAWSR